MLVANKRQLNFHFFVSFYPAIFSISILIENIFNTNFVLPSVVFVIFYFNLIIISIKNYGILSLYSLYLYTSFFFIYSKFFFTAIGFTSFLIDDWPVFYKFSRDSGFVLLIASFVSQFVLHLYVIAKIPLQENANSITVHNEKLQKISLFFFFLSFPLILVKEIIAFKYINNHGYLFLYSGRLNVEYPFWTNGSGTLFYLSFLFLLVSKPSKKIFKLASFLFISYLFIDALKGSRAAFICGVAAILYFYNKFYPEKIKFRQLIFAFIFLMLIALFIGQFRDSRNSKDIQLNANTTLNFFNSQSVSIAVPLSLIEWKDKIKEYRHYPYIFTELFAPFYNLKYSDLTDCPSVERVRIRNEIEGAVSYAYSPEWYLKGWGLGSAFLAEAYDFLGFLGIVVWSLALGFLINTMERKISKNSAYIFFAWFVVNSVLFLPRGHFFAFITSSYKYCIFAFILYGLVNFLIYPKKIRLNIISTKKRSLKI